jgi:Anti-sigma-K factor rskA, C-terminal/Putative zinc-finger
VKIRRTDPHTLLGAYALDALPGAERARFARHLSVCESCRQEARGLLETTARLATGAVTEPPERTRDKVLTAAARTRQLPPLTRQTSAWPGRRWGVAAACGMFAVALAFGGIALNRQDRLSQEQAHARAIAAVLNAPDATMMTARAAAGGTATVVMSHLDHALVFTAARLPALPPSRRYQLWLMGSGGARSEGMLPMPRAGVTAPVVVNGLAAGDRVGLTVEPAAGARHPTSSPVLLLALPSGAAR